MKSGGSWQVCWIGCLLMFVCSVSAGAATQGVRRSVALREGPGSFYPVLEQVRRGVSVTTGESRGKWVKAATSRHRGWLPKSAFAVPRKGIDYAGLLGSDKAVVISSVDIAAATKGAFESRYSESRKANFELIDELDGIRIDPVRVSAILQGLRPAPRSMLQSLPRRVYKNNVIVDGNAEHLLGRAMAATLVTPGMVDDRNVVEYVNEVAAVVGMQTSRYDLPFRVAIIDDDSIGGFGLPGGYIVITKGLLKEAHSEAELACLLGHEMAHICLYHGLREFNKRGTHRKSDSAFAELDAAVGGSSDAFAELNNLSGATNEVSIEKDLARLADTSYLKVIGRRAREDELEADLYGAAYAAAAGYDPQAFVNYLERARGQNLQDAFRHHPPLEDRIAALRSDIRRYHLARRGQVEERGRFEAELAGLKK